MFSAASMAIGMAVVAAVLLGIVCTALIATTLVRDELALRRSRRATRRPPWQGWSTAQTSPAETVIPPARPVRCAPIAGAQRTHAVACVATPAHHA